MVGWARHRQVEGGGREEIPRMILVLRSSDLCEVTFRAVLCFSVFYNTLDGVALVWL